MRTAITVVLLAWFGWQTGREPMTVPKVEHHQRQQTQTYDEITRSCPAGYEGHFVDTEVGFDSSDRFWTGSSTFSTYPSYSGEPGYTICFDTKFMDGVRKNPELLIARPQPPRPI